MKFSPQSQPLISVIIPVYNVERHLRRCMDSICGQTYAKLDIICVDDGSTDGSLSILREYEQNDPRVWVITQANSGVAAARNKALEIARGEWITYIDPDDWMMPDAYESILKQADDDVEMILFGSQALSEDERIAPEQVARMQHYMDHDFVWEGRQSWDPYMTFHTTCTVWNKLFLRSTCQACGLRFDENLWNNSDFCFYIQFGAHVRHASYVDLHPHRYSLRGDSISFTKDKEAYEKRCRSHLLSMERILIHYKELSLVSACQQLLQYTIWHTAERLFGYRAFTSDRNMWASEFLATLQRCGFTDDARFSGSIRNLMEKFRGGRLVEYFLKTCQEKAVPCQEKERFHLATVISDALLVPCVLTLQSIREELTASLPLCVHLLAASSLSPRTRSILEKIETQELAILIHEFSNDTLNMLPPAPGIEPHAGYLVAALPEMLPNIQRCLFLQPGLLVKQGLSALQSWEPGEGMVGAIPLPQNEEVRKLCNTMQKREWWREQTQERYYSSCLLWLNLKAMRKEKAAAAWLDASLMRLEVAPYPMRHALNLALQEQIVPLPEEEKAYLTAFPGHTQLSPPAKGYVSSLIPEVTSPSWPLWNSYYENSPLAVFPLKDLLTPQPTAAAVTKSAPPVSKPTPAPKTPEASKAEEPPPPPPPKPVDLGILAMLRGTITRRYYRFCLLYCITWGRRHKHYKQKKKECKLLLSSLEEAAASNYAMWRQHKHSTN